MNPSQTVHPQPDHKGKVVVIHHPSQPTSVSAWTEPGSVAAVLPGGEMPLALNGIAFRPWAPSPTSPNASKDGEALAQQQPIPEPDFHPPIRLAAAAGVVIQEPDGRIWFVCPTNQFGGYEITFPKGRQEEGASLQATALVEAYEESGLQVRLIRHLADVPRTTTYTRYYLAERVGGTPSAMGWESQCVMLVPQHKLASLNLRAPDLSVVSAL